MAVIGKITSKITPFKLVAVQCVRNADEPVFTVYLGGEEVNA